MTITVYSKPGCHQCDATTRSLDKLELPYSQIDVVADDAARQYVTELGYTGMPVVIADNQHWSGFRPDRISTLVDCP